MTLEMDEALAAHISEVFHLQLLQRERTLPERLDIIDRRFEMPRQGGIPHRPVLLAPILVLPTLVLPWHFILP